ncbi:hypothetical protein [Frankia sp. KB5]|uniref:hypothetical protein n=1 Tax=Frankia sp. KB5 TaxID=683318 RepID=UPI001054279D|nr:hypothetical protein [Frankia sp. KB5]
MTLTPDLPAVLAATERRGRTAIIAGWDGHARAVAAVADTVTPTSPAAVAEPRALGLGPILLTGEGGASVSAAGGDEDDDGGFGQSVPVAANLSVARRRGVSRRLDGAGVALFGGRLPGGWERWCAGRSPPG